MIPEKEKTNKALSLFVVLTEHRRRLTISLRVGDRVEELKRPRWIAVRSLLMSRTLLACMLHLNELSMDVLMKDDRVQSQNLPVSLEILRFTQHWVNYTEMSHCYSKKILSPRLNNTLVTRNKYK